MSNSYHHIAIALAGVCQSATLVPELANQGRCKSDLYLQSIKTLFNFSPKTTEDVFGGVENVKVGLNVLVRLFQSTEKSNLDVMRYTLSVLSVTNKLIKNNEALEQISTRLDRIQLLYPDLSDDVLAENEEQLTHSLAGIYSDVISPLTRKIRVEGKITYLQNTITQAKVRTALLCCVRSAILWNQVGGTRFQLILSRKKIMNAAKEILAQI